MRNYTRPKTRKYICRGKTLRNIQGKPYKVDLWLGPRASGHQLTGTGKALARLTWDRSRFW